MLEGTKKFDQSMLDKIEGTPWAPLGVAPRGSDSKASAS